METLLVLLGIGVIGFGVFSAYSFMNPSRTASDRLAEFTGVRDEDLNDDPALKQLAERLATMAAQSGEDADFLRRSLVHAGYRGKHAAELFTSVRVMLALTLPVLASGFLINQSPLRMGGGVLFAAALGYIFPQSWLTGQVEARQKKLLRPFPDALDLMVVSVEAGLGLDAAFRRVADELEFAAPELAAEFRLVNNETGAGVPRVEALRHLYDRTGLDTIKSLVNMLVQAERFGTSVARSLRVHANITREKRMARAEEEAAKVSPKLTVVMILFLMPCLFIVIMGPAAVNIRRNFLKN
ncbi:MAG: type II secretion system F family protein [Deltaproteobacteria bacterium]|nr:MAG: type II secretion system F family protein [Deltaproteobacteria bacterium]